MVIRDMSIPIPKTLVIWASPSHIWVRVRLGSQGMPISLGFWEWGCPYHCDRVLPLSEGNALGKRLYSFFLPLLSRASILVIVIHNMVIRIALPWEKVSKTQRK